MTNTMPGARVTSAHILPVKLALAAFMAVGAFLPAYADATYSQGKRMSLQPGHDHCFAVVRVENTVGNYNEIETLETERGPVSIRYKTIGGHNPKDHDIVEVMSLPEGVAAWPFHIDLPDGDNADICLMLGVGS